MTLSDNTYDLVAKGCTIPATLAVGAHFDCNYSAVVTTGTTTNVATGDTTQTPPDDGTATVTATAAPPPAGLTIDKTNNAPIVNVGGTGLPTAAEGSTVTFTLTYVSTNGSVDNGTIKDVIPAGLTYVTGSATSNSEFTFAGYDSATRTLSWTAAHVTTSGSVTYQATVDDRRGRHWPSRSETSRPSTPAAPSPTATPRTSSSRSRRWPRPPCRPHRGPTSSTRAGPRPPA